MLTFLAALAAPVPGACGAAAAPALRVDCVEALAAKTDAELAAVKAALPEAIDTMSGEGLERSAEDVAAWKRAAAAVADLWAGYRDARCDAALLRFETGRDSREAAASCRTRISGTAASDLRLRYRLDDKGFGRRDVESPETEPRRIPDEEGPCHKVPPAECDYCGVNHCWEALLRSDDADLNAAWRHALAHIAARPRLSAAQRTDWTERLRKSQRLWLRWRDENCALERTETPNPFAHSIYSLVTGPCLSRETEARTSYLRRTYGR